MKKLILCTGLVLSGLAAKAQIICVGVSPSGIAKNYDFSWAAPSNSWGTPDFNIPNTNITDTLVLVNDGTPGTNTTYGNKLSEEGCNPSTPNQYKGKIVVIRRNTCEFGVKAKNAQDAGAVGVIIVNRDPDLISMGAGAEGANVTIPTIMLNNADGNALIAAMEGNPVVMFIGNKVGLNPNDLTMFPERTLRPTLGTFNTALASSAADLGLKFGSWVFNFGQNDQSGVNIKLTVKKEAAVVYQATSNKVNLTTGDSVFIAFNNPVLSSYGKGNYSYMYELMSDSVDNEPGDNTLDGLFSVSDSIVSLTNLNSTGAIDGIAYYSPAVPAGETPYSEWRSCMTYTHPNASNLAFDGVYFSASSDSLDLTGYEITYNLYTWDDPMLINDAANQQYNLIPLRSGSFYYENNDQKLPQFVKFDSYLKANNNQLYMVCLTAYDSKIRFPYSDIVYDENITDEQTWKYPVFRGPESSGTSFAGGFGVAPAFGLRAFNSAKIGLNEFENLTNAYPNPTKGEVTVVLPANGEAQLTVTDLAGRTIKTEKVTVEGKQLKTDLSGLNAGTYVFNLTYVNGSMTTFKVALN